MGVKERIQQYIDKKRISVNSFENSINASNGYWRKTKSISANVVSDILRIYSDINPIWVMTGEGEMIKNISESDSQNNIQLPEVPEANKSETETIKSLLSVISDQANILKQVTNSKEQKHIEEQKEMFNKIESLQKSLDNQGKYLQTLCKKIDDLISENNIPGQKKVG